MVAYTFVLNDMDGKQHNVLSAQSIYKIPPADIKNREDVYEFYKDALLMLNEAYQYAQTQMPALPIRSFAYQPIEGYQKKINAFFNLLNS